MLYHSENAACESGIVAAYHILFIIPNKIINIILFDNAKHIIENPDNNIPKLIILVIPVVFDILIKKN